jgi:hypothetical protein
MWKFIESIWEVINSPNNDPIIIGFIIGFSALLISSIRSHINYRKLIKEKDERIKDLINERNKLQNFLLKQKNVERRTSSQKKRNS